MELKGKFKKFTAKQLARAVVETLICGALVIVASLIKFYLTGDSVKPAFWFNLIYLIILVSAFYGGLLMYVMLTRTFIVQNNRYYLAFLVTLTAVFIIHLYLSLISPLLIAPGLTSMILVQLSRKKQDAFVFNLIEAGLSFCVLIYEAITTDGSVYMLVGGEADALNLQMWLTVIITVINIGAGAVIPVAFKDKTNRLHYVLVGLLVTVASALSYVLMSLAYSDITLALGLFWLVLISGIIPLIAAQFAVPLSEKIFNLVTDNRLIELTDARQPLLRRLAAEAPGTYSHSMAVANFAEMCAVAIGEDPYLARAAAYYHDIGKLSNPFYFSENQAGYNPHDDILPEVSAEIIRKHTTEGMRLCMEYKLPYEVAQVTVEHHGTLPIFVFYERAKHLTDGEVDIRDYSYHGVNPTSRISAIIMICDSSEAAIRAMDRPDGERVDRLLRSIIADRISKGQFDNCSISLKDLDIIRKTIINAYGGLFHTRVKYPGGEK